MAEKVTVMVLNVDLQSCKCYKKVKKVLCKFPQIRDQVYDYKANTVTIRVVCCDPERLRDKLCCKGGGSIKSIEIKPSAPEKTTEPAKQKEPPAQTSKTPERSPPPSLAYPAIGCCCTKCYHGIPWGPCHYGRPHPPPCYGIYCRPVYDNCGCGCGCGGRGYSYCYTKRTGECFSDENSNGCSIM